MTVAPYPADEDMAAATNPKRMSRPRNCMSLTVQEINNLPLYYYINWISVEVREPTSFCDLWHILQPARRAAPDAAINPIRWADSREPEVVQSPHR